MNSRSQTSRRCARGLIAGGVVAVVLMHDHSGLSRSVAQEPAPPAKGAIRKDQPSSALTPDVRLRVQRLKTRKARAAYEIARLNREVTEIALEEYRLGTYAQDLATLDGEIKLAEAERIRAADRLDWARRMFEKGYVSKVARVSEELNFEKAKDALEQARAKRDVLDKYTGPKTIKTRQADVEKARTVEIDKEAEWVREVARQVELERELNRT